MAGSGRNFGRGAGMRSLRLGVSAACIVLVSTEFAPAIAQVNNLAGAVLSGAGARNALVGFTTVTNGTLNLTPLAGGLVYNGGFNDSLGTFTLTKLGTDPLTLGGGGLNSFTGDTTVSLGILQAGAANVLSPNSLLEINGGSVDIAGFNQTVAALRGSGPVINSGGAATLTLSGAGIYSFNGDISGNTTVVKSGSGTQSFGGTKTYSGGTIVTAGTLRYTSDAAFGSGAVTINSAAAFDPGNNGRTIANNIVLNDDVQMNVGGFIASLTGNISGGAGNQITKNDFGTLELSGTNSFAGGVLLTRGQINLGSDSALGTGKLTTTIAQVSVGTVGNISLTLANDIELNGILNFELPNAPNVITFNGTITDGSSGIGTLFLKTGTATLVATGTNTYSGFTRIGSGIFGFGSDAAAGTSIITSGGTAGLAAYGGNRTIANQIRTSANLTVDTRGFDMTFTGVVRDNGPAGGIEKLGLGTLTLANANTYTGDTIVTTGTLLVDGSITSNVNVNSGATLGGSGTVGSANTVTVNSGGILSPGTGGAGTLTLGNLVLNSGSIFNVDLANPASIGGGVNDLVNVTNALTLNNGTINVLALPGFTAGTYRVINFGSLSGSGLLVAGAAPPSYVFAIDVNAALGQVNLLVLPGSGPVQYWDGANLAGNGVINGGPGTWNAANTNWTSLAGTPNAVWGGGTGIFQAVGGAVAVVGTQSYENLVFNVNGYVLSGGVLQANAGTILVANGATTVVNSVVAGTNGLTKTGSGNLALTAANSYTGGTDIQSGTVTVSNALSLSTGDVRLGDNSTLANGVAAVALANNITTVGAGTIDSSAGSFALGGAISGAGSLTKIGTGTLTVTGASSFSGGLTIADGTLIGSSGSVGSGPIVNDTALVFDQTAAGTLASVISGAGTLTKTGAGVLTLSAINTITGPTTVTAGTLSVTGSTAASATTVQTGASLTGTGTVGTLTVQAGGTVNPGTALVQSGTLTVDGALTLASGSTLVIDVGTDLLSATGPAAIAGNLVINPVIGGFQFGEQVIVASSARTGEFDTTTFTTSFGPAVNVTVGYSATTVFLDLTPGSLVAAGGASLSPNSLEVASAFDRALAQGYDPSPFAALYAQGPNLNNALLQLSGELHSAERRVLMEDTRVVRETAFDRLNTGLSAIAGDQQVSNEVNDGEISYWLRGAGAWGNADADGTGSSFNTVQWGILTGIDYAKDGYRTGAMFFYTSSDIDYIQLGQSTVDTIGGAIYGGYRADQGWAVGLGGAYGSNSADGTRVVTTPGLAQTLQSSIDGTSYQVFGEIAYDLMASPQTRVEPFVRVAYVGVTSDAFQEIGGIAAIEAAKQSNDLTLVTSGLRGAWESGGFRASASAAWQYATGDLSGVVNSTISQVDSLMSINATALDQNSAAIEVQASYGFTDKVRLGFGYSGIIGPNNANNGLRATLAIAF